MKLPFYKYQATGNDFVLINQTVIRYLQGPDRDLVARLCDRRFGIGADGLILLESSEYADFKMVYYNADGGQSTMCGNGGRCMVRFARNLDLIGKHCTFEAIDGLHEAMINNQDLVELKMKDVSTFAQSSWGTVLDTGSPHLVRMAKHINDINVLAEGRSIRNSGEFVKDGINVNFMEPRKNGVHVRTYERGVEDETFSCGTGVTACALVASLELDQFTDKESIDIYTRGGQLTVKFNKVAGGFTDIWLIGPAEEVYQGAISL